ncbi:MAG: MFS transporter [Ruminococcaceae bacterium]|nr:MFS transporter [Oscillospiraceae bacterium]
MQEKLWNKNFTLIIFGTIISMLGNSISGFAIALLVLDNTASTFLYALFMVIYNAPKLIVPIFAGPYLDRYSRRKMIYLLDYLSAALYLMIFFLLKFWGFHFWLFLGLAFLIGSIDSVYRIAYDSLFPTLISEKNYRRAYSISSIIEPLSTVMIPVAAFAYEKIGLELMFLANAVTFFCAASFEVFIKAEENYTKNQFAQGFAAFKQTLKEGISYLKNEKGLLFITAFFCVNAFAYSGIGVVLLPYFKSLGDNGVLLYTLVMGCGVVGRLMGGVMHYLVVFAKEKKFLIAMSVYVSLTLLDSTYLYTPVFWMCISSFIVGVISVTSYNIRLTSTQSYVPDTCRARFNSTFLLLCNVGNIAGQLSAGVVADLIPMRAVVTIYALANLVGALTIMLPNRKKIAPIYNREV